MSHAIVLLVAWSRSHADHHVRRMARVDDRFEIELARGAEVIGASTTQLTFDSAVRTAVMVAQFNELEERRVEDGIASILADVAGPTNSDRDSREVCFG